MGRLRIYSLASGSSLMGRFERRRVVASITPRNWRTKGVVFRKDGELVYASVMSWRERDDEGFAVHSVTYRDGAWSSFGRSNGSFADLDDAIAAVNALKTAADAAEGAVARAELPSDAAATTFVVSQAPRPGRG